MSLRPQIKQLREFMAHPSAFGGGGAFSGGYSFPPPGSGRMSFSGPWQPRKDFDPDELDPEKIVARAKKRLAQLNTMGVSDPWAKFKAILQKRRRRGM